MHYCCWDARWVLGTRFIYYTAIHLLVSAYVPVIQLTCPRYTQMVTWTIVRSIGFEPLKYSTITPQFGLEKVPEQVATLLSPYCIQNGQRLHYSLIPGRVTDIQYTLPAHCICSESQLRPRRRDRHLSLAANGVHRATPNIYLILEIFYSAP